MNTRKLLNPLLRTCTIVFSLVVLVGCDRELTLKTSTTPGDVNAGAPVILDGQSAGYVRMVDPAGHAVLVITNQLAAESLRRGTTHVSHRGRVVLDTSNVSPTAPWLKNREVIPTYSRGAPVTQQWSTVALIVISLAAVFLAVWLVIRLLFRTATSLWPLLMALLLAAVCGWVLTPVLTPLVGSCYEKVAKPTKVGDEPEDVDASALGRWQSRAVGVLGTLPDMRIVSFFIVTTAALPFWCWFISRMRCMSRASVCIVPAALMASAATTFAGSSGVSVSRDYSTEEQAGARALIVEAEGNCSNARPLPEAGLLPEANEESIRINFNLDQAMVRCLVDHLDRFGNLPV